MKRRGRKEPLRVEGEELQKEKRKKGNIGEKTRRKK